MNPLENHGLIIRELRKLQGLSVRKAALKIDRSIPTDQSIFAVEIPFAGNISSIQIATQSGKVLTTVNPNSQLLIDTIKSIPDTSFNRDPTHSRWQLLDKAKRIEFDLNRCETVERQHNQNGDRFNCSLYVIQQILKLRKQVRDQLNDSIQTSSPTQLTKSQVLATIDIVALRLVPNRTVKFQGRETGIQILPAEGGNRDDVLKIVSVIQGKNGAVTIDGSGAVTYRSYSARSMADTFSVAIQDPEGDTQAVTVATEPCD